MQKAPPDVRARISLFATAALLSLLVLTASGFAQQGAARPIFTALPPHNIFPNAAPAPTSTALTQWVFTFTYNGTTYTPTLVGTDPSKNNTTTTIPTGIIPIKMVYNNGQNVFDPASVYAKGVSATQMVATSVIFKPLVDYNQGGTDLGKTQYLDAYERGNFWGYGVQSNTNYHLLLRNPPVIAPEQTLNVPANVGSVITNPWSGIPTGTADINWFDTQLQTIMAKFKQIAPNVLPIFLTYNVYLTEFNQCCIGGYHSANGPQPNGQTYIYTTTISQAANPVFSQDISALSHEVGEWIVDPFVDNPACGGLMEVGDPLENNPDFGDHPYTVNGFTYNPQDLVFMRYFGAPSGTSVNSWWTFQNFGFSQVCQAGQ